MSQQTYCLDITTGYHERDRDELITFLQKPTTMSQFELTRAQRGMLGDTKLLRVLTPKACELEQFIIDNMHNGDDNDYEVHVIAVDAQRSMTWLPDYDTEHGYKEFELTLQASA